ncbi:hypothetical protein QNH14_16730 [Apirhabdus apintestini]|nr:hypothetical protein QNH14_16730 [Enterobacteriaceae bacterium CA-0114]
MPANEAQTISFIDSIIMDTRLRALQQQGRFEAFSAFKPLARYIEAAALAFYSGNVISAFLTLVPVIEGIILRWSGYQQGGKKLSFADLRTFLHADISGSLYPATLCFMTYFPECAPKSSTIIYFTLRAPASLMPVLTAI